MTAIGNDHPFSLARARIEYVTLNERLLMIVPDDADLCSQ